MTDLSLDASQKPVPPEIDRWNWGAFLLNWIWGVGNGTYIALLTFIPFFGILIMPFVLGAKGSAWAWRNGRWDSVAHFKRVQRLWAIWGAVIWVGLVVVYGAVFGTVFYVFGHSEPYRLAVARLQASPQAIEALGTPITTGWTFGNISTEGTNGEAVLTFSAKGPKASGRVFINAKKTAQGWTLTSETLHVDGRTDGIDILKEIHARLGPIAPSRMGRG